MDLFLKAHTVRLISYRDKYLVAEADNVTVTQRSNGSARNAIWTVEFVEGKDCIRLKSCFGTYLTATSMAFLPGFSGKKVIQRWPSQVNNSASEWEPLRDGMQLRLRSPWGYFLHPDSALPPWRNSVTHNVPHWRNTWEKVLWNVEVVEKCPRRQRRMQQGYPTSGRLSRSSPGYSMKRVLLKERMESFSVGLRLPWYRRICLSHSRKFI